MSINRNTFRNTSRNIFRNRDRKWNTKILKTEIAFSTVSETEIATEIETGSKIETFSETETYSENEIEIVLDIKQK
jgi:hypothetical protein